MADEKELTIKINLDSSQAESDLKQFEKTFSLFADKRASYEGKLAELSAAGLGDSLAARHIQEQISYLDTMKDRMSGIANEAVKYKQNILETTSKLPGAGSLNYNSLGSIASNAAGMNSAGNFWSKYISAFTMGDSVAKRFQDTLARIQLSMQQSIRGGSWINVIAEKMKKASEATHKAHKRMNIFKKALSKIESFSLYRFVRSLIMTLVNGLKEGIQNLAQFDKAMGNIYGYNDALSQMATKWLQIKNTLGVLGASIVSALMPVITAVANGFIKAANAVNAFFAALTGRGTYLKAKEVFVDYAGSLNKASSSAKDFKRQIMGFDELNVLSDKSGSGAGTDPAGMFEPASVSEKMQSYATAISDGFKEIADKVKAHLDTLLKIIGTGLAALGVVMLLMGNIPLGIGLLTAGLAAYSTGSIGYGTVIQDVAGSLDRLINIASKALLALGVITMWFNLPIGISLIIAGVAGLVTAATIHQGEVENNVSGMLGKITAIASGALLAIGLILALSGANVPLGLGMMVAGGIGLASVVAVNWNAILERLKAAWGNIKQFGTEVKAGIVGFGAWLKQAASDWVQSIIDGFNEKFPLLSSLLGKIGSAVGVGYNWISNWFSEGTSNSKIASTVYRVDDYYASGGTVPTGDLFIANEAGPELVGTVGGKTTVTNQDQFTAGLASANEMVVQATLAAANAIVSAINSKDTNIELDGVLVSRQIYQAMNNESTRRGTSLIQGA